MKQDEFDNPKIDIETDYHKELEPKVDLRTDYGKGIRFIAEDGHEYATMEEVEAANQRYWDKMRIEKDEEKGLGR